MSKLKWKCNQQKIHLPSSKVNVHDFPMESTDMPIPVIVAVVALSFFLVFSILPPSVIFSGLSRLAMAQALTLPLKNPTVPPPPKPEGQEEKPSNLAVVPPDTSAAPCSPTQPETKNQNQVSLLASSLKEQISNIGAVKEDVEMRSITIVPIFFRSESGKIIQSECKPTEMLTPQKCKEQVNVLHTILPAALFKAWRVAESATRMQVKVDVEIRGHASRELLERDSADYRLSRDRVDFVYAEIKSHIGHDNLQRYARDTQISEDEFRRFQRWYRDEVRRVPLGASQSKADDVEHGAERERRVDIIVVVSQPFQ